MPGFREGSGLLMGLDCQNSLHRMVHARDMRRSTMAIRPISAGMMISSRNGSRDSTGYPYCSVVTAIGVKQQSSESWLLHFCIDPNPSVPLFSEIGEMTAA